MEVSALKYSGAVGLHGRSPLLRLQSDERLVHLTRRGNSAAFEVLVSRYESRLLAFTRHLVGSREDAEDVLQDVMAAAYNAMLADDRPINVRPWLYRIARNRSLNHLRRAQAIASDTMDVHLSEHGATTADKVHEREEFRLLVGDIRSLPETQRTALVLREMDALSYEQIAEAMETTVPSVKSLLVRARVGLAEAAEARLLSCDQVRIELGEVAEGLQRRAGPLVRRHLKTCSRCRAFQAHLKETNRALAILLPIGPLVVLKKLALTQLSHSAGSSATAAGSGATAATGLAAGGLAVGSGSGGLLSAGIGAIATKTAAGLAAAALVTAGAVEVDPPAPAHHPTHPSAAAAPVATAETLAVTPAPVARPAAPEIVADAVHRAVHRASDAGSQQVARAAAASTTTTPTPKTTPTTPTTTTPTTTTPTTTTPTTTTPASPTAPGRTDTTTVATVLPASQAGTPPAVGTLTPASPSANSGSGGGTTTTTSPATATTPTTTTTSPATTTTPTTTSPAATNPTLTTSGATTTPSSTTTTPGTTTTSSTTTTTSPGGTPSSPSGSSGPGTTTTPAGS